MALVDYSDSEDDNDCDEGISIIPKPGVSTSKSSLPPLSSQFHNLYATKVRSRDDPSLHDGRIRSTPHVQGNWPSHVYIEWSPTSSETEKISRLISHVQSKNPHVHNLLISDLGAPQPLHISLSPPIGLLTAQKDAYLEMITSSIKNSTIRPFQVKFISLNWVSNSENTRWFLVLRLEPPPGNELNKLLGRCNAVGQEFGQPPLYVSASAVKSDPSLPDKRQKLENSCLPVATRTKGGIPLPAVDEKFHVSIAWTLTRPDQTITELAKEIEAANFSEVSSLHMEVKEIKVKIGNIITSVSLPEKVMMEMGIF